MDSSPPRLSSSSSAFSFVMMIVRRYDTRMSSLVLRGPKSCIARGGRRINRPDLSRSLCNNFLLELWASWLHAARNSPMITRQRGGESELTKGVRSRRRKRPPQQSAQLVTSLFFIFPPLFVFCLRRRNQLHLLCLLLFLLFLFFVYRTPSLAREESRGFQRTPPRDNGKLP